jgi:hypothetical protein
VRGAPWYLITMRWALICCCYSYPSLVTPALDLAESWMARGSAFFHQRCSRVLCRTVKEFDAQISTAPPGIITLLASSPQPLSWRLTQAVWLAQLQPHLTRELRNLPRHAMPAMVWTCLDS